MKRIVLFACAVLAITPAIVMCLPHLLERPT